MSIPREVDLSDLLKELRGESEPSLHSCIIAVTKLGDAYLIKSDPSLDEIFDGGDLSDNLTCQKNVPSTAGIFACIISYH